MRIWKPSYSKPLPPGAKIVTKKGVKYARFKGKRGLEELRLTDKGDRVLCEVKKYVIQFDDHLGIKRKVKAYTDKAASTREADNIQRLVTFKASQTPLSNELQEWVEKLNPKMRDELISFGLIDMQRAEIAKPLSEHIPEYTDHLRRKERSERYVKEVCNTLTRVFTDCGFHVWSDISPSRLRDYLDGLRDGGKGISKRTYNGLLVSTKSFCRWMVRQQKATSSPIEYLDGLDNQQTDRRHPRRVLDLEDFRRFLEAASKGEEIRGLSGPERNLLYRFAAESGLRGVDIRRLRVKDFDFSSRKLTIQADQIKNKTAATVFLKPATAAELQQYCQNKLPNAHVFYVTIKTVDLVKHDLRSAGIPYCVDGEYFDFHSLRHQCASLLAMNPDTPEAVRQEAMRHKSPEMTRHYSHVFESQQREAVESLPDLTQPSRESQAAVKTGTESCYFSCVDDTSLCQLSPSMESVTVDTVEKTPLRPKEEGIALFKEQTPGCLNTSKRSPQPPKNQPLTETGKSGVTSNSEILADFLPKLRDLSLDVRKELCRLLESE
ncbi:MAG: tyrosine-type recombinase/integrase [Planctomycetota bacterium]